MITYTYTWNPPREDFMEWIVFDGLLSAVRNAENPSLVGLLGDDVIPF